MTTQPQSRTTFPVRPFAIVAVVAIGVAVGMTFAWYRGSDDSNETTTSTALAPWVRPAGPNAVESLAVEKAIRESGSFSTAVTGTLAEHDNAITGALGPIVASAAAVPVRTIEEVMADAFAPYESAFPPYETLPLSPIVVAPSIPEGQTFDEAMADAIAQHGNAFPVSTEAPERKLSPTGVNGFRDFDPEQVVPHVADR